MSWQNQRQQQDMSVDAPVFQPGIHVADFENQAYQAQYQGINPYIPFSMPGVNQGMVFTGSDYLPPGTAVDGLSQHHPNQCSPQFNQQNSNDYSNPANTYMPGMPLQTNHFTNHQVNMPREQTYGNTSYNQMQPGFSEGQRGKSQYPFKGRGRNSRNQGRGRGRGQHNGASGYSSHAHWQEEAYLEDGFSYDPNNYQEHSFRNRTRGGYSDDFKNQRGRDTYSQQNFKRRNDNKFEKDDGRPQRNERRNNSRHGPDQTDSSSVPKHKEPRSSASRTEPQIKSATAGANGSGQSDASSTHQSSSTPQTDGGNGTSQKDTSKKNKSYGKVNDFVYRSNDSQDFNSDGRGYQRGNRRTTQSLRNEIPQDVDKVPKNSEFKENKFRKDLAAQNSTRGGRGRMGTAGRYSGSGKGYRNEYKGGASSVDNDESQRGTLTEQLSTNKYECMVCCDNIHVESPVWSCQNCYHVFHLSCIQKWAQSSICKDTRSWRCPGCQNVSSYIPTQYRCFCGQRRDPNYIKGEIPHSCGETCRKRRKGGCKHPCTILCHPGPCPPCSSMIWLTCDCGKDRKHVRCSTAVSFKCEHVCNKVLNCQDHKCQQSCHSGLCSRCEVSKTQECFCQKTTRKAMCGSEEFKMTSFSCEKPCGRTLACGNHVCEELCHPGDCAPCSLMPGNLETCCCGKTPIGELGATERLSCLDPVPTCGKVCNKLMACGSPLQPHLCDKKCHEGECGPCSKETQLKCECGATEKKMPCEVAVTFNDRNPFKCQRRCGKKKTCARHKCSDNCCVKDIHICEIVCGKKLSCGIHKCEELCHRGNCKRCLQASFDELTCYCGAEVLEPPVQCGTKPPACQRTCTRQHDCEHPVRHTCHVDEDCPPCTELTDKLCGGGHMTRKNVPCHLTNISCGYPCNKPLPCGLHKCQKTCHKGECLEEGAVCTQPCSRLRPGCGHPCSAPCHTGECRDSACKTEITITCPCGNRSAKALCLMGGDLSAEITQFQRLSVQSMAESGGQSVDMSQFSQTKTSNKRLDCDTNCAIIERNRRFALALEIKNPDMNAKLGNPTFTDFLKDFAKKNPKFALGVEKNLSDLVQSAKQSAQPTRSHAFQSMNRDQRRFVHELAEFYGCQTQSYDYEPNKNIVATAAKDRCWLPNGTLTQFVLKDQLPKAPPPISTFKTQGVTFTVLEKKKTAPKDAPSSSSSRAWENVGATASSSASKQPPAIDYFDFTGDDQ